jgi:mono/diheme cytochrome c family protein
VVHDSLRYLTDADLLAMAVYLKDQQSTTRPITPDKPRLPAERLTAGKLAYEDNCSSCHQADGKGIAGSAPALAGNSAVTAEEPYNVIMAMLEGFQPQGSWGAMGSFASLSDDQITDIANYVRTAWSNQGLPNATPWSVGNWRKNAQAANTDANALLCPSLPQDVMQPVFSAGPAVLKQAATDREQMRKLVGSYAAARPKASTAQTIEALSTGYCRALADDHLSQSRMSAQIADFAQRVAVSAAGRRPAAHPAT